MANIKDTVGSLFDTASKGLSDVKESVSEAASYAGDKIGDIVDYALETPQSPQADQFKAGFQDFGKRIEESKNAPTISDSIVDLYNQGKQNLSDNYNQLKEDLIPARDAIGRTIDNVIKEQISTPEERKNSLLGKLISGDSAFKETGAKFRKGDEELANDYAKINSEESSKGLVGAGYEAFKGLLSGSDLEKALPSNMSESDFFRRAGRFGQEINEESNRLATLQAESRFSAFTNFTNKLENEFRTVKGIPVTDQIDQDQLNEYFSMKLDTLPRSEAKTIINQYKSFNSEAKKIYDAINLKQDNMKAFLNETLKFPGKTGEEVYNDFSEKANANESTNKYIKVLKKQFNLAKSDVDKQLDFYAPALAKADNFKQWSELVDSMYETSAQQKSYIANARNLPISKGLQDEIISKGYDSYDASLRYMGEYAKLWADPEMRKQYPDTKYSTLEFKKIVMHEVEKNISAADKKAIEDMDKLMARVEIERNRNSASNTKLDLSNKKFNIPFVDEDLILENSPKTAAGLNIGTYLGKQGYYTYGVAGGIGTTAGLGMRDKAGYYAENIADYYHQYNPLGVAGGIGATAGLWMRDKAGYRTENVYQGGSSEFRDIARKYREQNGEAYLDRTIRSEFNGLLRSGEDAVTAGKELVAGNSTEIIPMIMGIGLVSLGTKVIRVGADIGTKTIGTGINKAINSTIANPKVLKQVTNIGEKLQAGQAAKLAQSTGNAIKAKTNDITTSISTRLGFDDIQIPTILQTSAKMAGKIANNTANTVGKLTDYSIKSIGSSAVTDPTFNVIAGDAPTDMIQGMNATIGLLFDAGISTGISTVKGGYRFGKKLTGYATGKEISAPTPETTIFQETGRFLNDSMNNIMYGFVTGNQMKAVKQVQDAYIKNGINLSGQEAKALLDSGAAMYRSIYDPKQVSDLFNNKGELATFLAKNISEMDKNNMTELLTGKGIGIKLHKFAGLEEGDFNNLLSLLNATKTLKDPGQQKAARLQINAYLNKVEDFVTGKGGVDRISIAKEFSDNKDIMAKNKAGFDKRKANLLSATTPEEISDAMDELNGFIYKIQATQGSERHKQIVTLTDGNPDNKITLTFEEISQLGDKNIDDLINEGRITIGKNEFGRKEGVYTVVDTRFEQTVTDIINGNQEIKQLINKFKENIDSGEYAVKIGSKELDLAIIGFFTGNKSKIEWTGIDPKLSIEYANLVRDIASKIFIDADIPQVVVIPNAEKGTAKMSSGANIINMLGEVEGDIVISTGSYVRKEGDDTINAIYITLGKNFTENPAMKSVFDTIDDKAGGVLNIYLSEVKKLMEDIFELSQDGKGLSLDKGRTLYTNLYDALGNPTKDENKILEDIYSITQDIESTHFIMDVLKKSNASNQSHAGLLAINLAYAYRLNKTLIDELIARGKKAGDNMDNIHSVFSKILLGNVQDVYARVFGKEYNFDIPTTEIADAYHRARLEYINGYENQKFLLKQENEKLTVDYNANKDTDVRKALKKLMKENDKRIKNIDKILSKVNTFKESFIKDLATKQAFGYIKSLADMVSYNFLFREADDIIGTTFMKATPPLLKRWIAGLLPPGGSVPDFVPPVEETKLIEGASQKLLGTSEQKLLATTGNIAGVEKAMTYQDALRELFMDSYNKLKELPPINQTQVLELLANYSKNKTTQLREAFYRDTMEKFNRDILGTKGKNSILIKKKELFKNLANEFLFSNPRLDLLDNISLDVLSGVTPVYSQAYLKDNPLVLISLTSAINGSTAGDESIKQAFLKTLGVPEGIDFIQYINSPEGAELKKRINDLYADNMNVYQKTDQRLKWIKGVVHSTMKDITIDTFDGNKKVNVTSDLLRKFFNSNQFADLIKTLKLSNEKVKVENVYDINGNLVEDYITIPLKLKRMEASGMDMKYTIGVDNIKVIQFFKDGVDIGSSSITKGLKAFRKKMIDDGYRFMGSFGDKDSYLQWYKPVDSKFDVETTYLQEYALSEKYIIGEPKSKKEILEALASGDDEGLNRVFKLTSITKREASQMSERNTFEKVDMPVMTYVFDETVNDKDLIPSITIYPDGTWESDITLSPSEFGHIQNHIDNAYIDGSLNIDKAYGDIEHYLENVFSKSDSKGNRKSYQDGFSVMSDKLMTLRNKISAYFKETDEVKDHVFGEHNGHAFMFKTQFNRGVIKFDGVEIEHGVAIGDGSFKMGGESYKDIKNMEPYPDGENHYIMIDDVPHRLKYPPFEISTQDFKSASSDSVKRQEQASTGSAIFARLPAEYADEIGEIQEQDITKLWNKTVGNLLDLNVNVSGYSRILKYMQALQEYTGVGDKHSSIISAKVDQFVNEVNALLTNTKVDAGSAYIRQVDRNISDQEILLSKNHPVVRKAQENTDSYVELENIKREELGQEALTKAEIASYRESQLVTTMYRFPVPSMYNIGVYKILVLEDELAKGNTKFKKYSKMGEKQMVLSPMVAYLKLEADFDGDKVFFAPLNTEYGQVIAKSILGVPASFDRADIGKYAVDAINNNEFRNKYVRTAQVEDIKVQKVERFKGRWTRADVKLQDDKVFLFGDNTDDRLNTHHIPSSTQAVIRGLPNAIGIDTKKNMGTNEDAVILPTIKSNPVNIDAKFPKDQTKANYSDGIIAYGTHSTGKYAERFDGTRTTFNVGETIMISVNGNNRANQAENVEKTKKAIDLALEKGVINFVADNSTTANSSHNSGGEGVIREYLISKGLQYREFNGVGLYSVTQSSYFTDADFPQFKQQVDEAIQKAKDSGKTIVISGSGIGTDKAQLEKRAPKLFKYLQSELNKLEKSSTKGDNKSIVQDRLTKLIAKKGIGEVSATYRSLFLLQQEVTMRLRKDPNFFDKLKQDSEWNLLKTFSMNREGIDSEMASGLQIVLDFGKSGLTEFDTQFLNDIIYKAFGVTSNSPYIGDIQKLVQSLSTSFGNNFPVSKFDFKAPMKDKFGKEIEEGSKPITKSGVIFDTMNSIFKQYSSYLSILGSNNEKKILSTTLLRNKLTSLRLLYSEMVSGDKYTMAGIKNNIFNGRDTPYVAYINRVNKELTDMINSGSIDGIVLSEAKKKMLLSLIDNFQKEFDSFISSIRSTKNTRALKDIKFNFYLSDHVDIARFSEEEKLVLAFMSSVYGERYLKDYYSAGDLTRYIIDTQEEGENNIRSVLNRMASDGYEVENLDSNAVLALFQRDTITKSDVKDLIENTKVKMDNLNQLKSELIETEAPSKELTESLETLNSAIKNTEKELENLEVQSEIVSIRDKALSKDDQESLGVYNQYVNYLLETPQAYNDLKQALDISRIRYNTLTNQEKQNSQLGLYSIASDINPDYLMDYLKTRFKNLANDLETNKKSFVENIKNKLTELNLNIDPYKFESDIQLMMKDIEDSNQLMQDQVIYDGVLELYNLRESIRGLTLPKYIESMTKYVNQFKDSIKKQTDIELNNLLFKVTKDIDDGYEDGSIRNIINDEVETLTNEVNAKLNKLVKDIFVPTDIVPYRALALYDNNKQLVPTNIGEYTYDEKTALSMNSIYDSDITNEFGDVSVVTPAYTPKMDYGSMLISVHDEGLMDDMIKEMDKLDRLQQDGLVFTLKKTTQKWLPDFYNLYEGIRNIVNYENKIPAASDYNVREFTWIPFVKNIYSILKDKKLSGSEIRSLMPEFQSMLLANNMGVYSAYDEDVITRALESLESKNELLLGISKDEAFRKRVTDYVTNVINPVADMLNEIQERVMKPNGDTIGKHYGITDKDSKASEYKNKLVQDLLESHKGDPQFARVLSSIYDKADLQKLLIDRQTERGEKIFYGTENNLNELMFGIDLGVLSKGLNAILGLTQSFNYSMKYGAVSLVTGSGMIAGISQLIPNTVELIAYKRAYSKDIDKGYDVMLKYNILDSENVIRNGTGHGKNIDPNIIGEAIGRVAAGVGYIPVKIGIGMYNVLANSIKISNSSVAQAIDGGKYAKAAGDLTNSFLTNPLGFFDFPLENMRKAVAVTTVMNNLGIKSLKEFDDIVERFGDKFLNKFNALVSGEFANTGGGVVSASSIQRRNVFDSAYNMVPAAIRPAAYFINKAAGFLMGWAFHKTAVGLEMTGNVIWSFKRLCDGDVKQSFAHFEAASRYTYMLAQQVMILLGLYMQMEKREKDPEDMQNWDNFLKAYSNIGVIYDMVFGKYVDTKMDINEIDPNASIGDQAGMFAYMQAEQIFRTFNQGEYARMVHDYYVKKNAAAGPNGEGVTIIDALLWALDQKYATSMRIINADLADRHYDTLNTANTAMLLTEGQSITDEVTDLFDKKKYDKFKSQGLWMSLLGMGSKLLGFTESEAVTASIAEDIRKQILGEDKEISKLYNGGQISEIPGDYQLSTIIGKTKNPITDDEKESVDNIWTKIGYYKYNAVDRQGKRIIANDASESKSQQIIEKEFERIQKEKGVDMEKLLSASPNSPEFEVALAMVATESNIATPTIIAYKLEKEYNNERTRLQKLVGKKEITGYKGLDAYQESEIKRNILTKNQVLLNLATPFAEIIVGEHMDKYHSDIFDRLTPKDGANETSKGAPDKNEYIKGEVINLINTHQLIAKNVAEGDTNVDRLTSKFALATKGISNTEVGANIIIGMLHDIERLPIDKKAKLANQAALIMGLNKSQYQFMKDNAEFEKLTEDSQRQLTNWMYKINTEVNDFDSNNLSFKANEAGSNYSKYPKTFKKTPYRIPGEYSKSGIGGQRPNFSKQFGGLQNMMSGKEDLVVPRYDKYLSNKEEEYARSLPPAPSYGSHYKQTFYRYTIQNTFYGYDSKGTLNPFINPSTVKGPVKRFIKLKKKFKKKK